MVLNRTPSNFQRATEELRDMIVSGRLAAGSDHLESELAAQLGMSRTPIREAALLLESQGLLILRPRKGVRILPISKRDMSEIYDVLTELESLSARTAAERNPSAAELATLEQATRDMEAALNAGNREGWAAADQRFHEELVRLGGNSRVKMIFEMMTNQVCRARALTLHLRPMPFQSNDDHKNVLAAIGVGNGKLAARLHRAHRERSKALLIDLLGKARVNHV